MTDGSDRSEYLIRPYDPRRLRYIGTADTHGWRVKTYAIVAHARRHDAGAIGTALARAGAVLPPPFTADDGEQNYGMAVLIAHFALDGCWYFLHWWVDDGLLRQRIFTAPLHRPAQLKDVTGAVAMTGVWELGVLDFERRCWIEYMMGRGDPQPGEYLRATFEGEV